MRAVWIEETDDVGYVVDPDLLTRISVSDGSWTLTAEQHLLLGSPMDGNEPRKGWAGQLLGTNVTVREYKALLTLRDRRLSERRRKDAARSNRSARALSAMPLTWPSP